MNTNTDPRIAKCLEAADKARWDATPRLYSNQNDVENGRSKETADPVGEFTGTSDGVLEVNGTWHAGGRTGVITRVYFERSDFSVDATPDEINKQLNEKIKPKIARWLFDSDFER
jgi:hypothetical protein